MLQHLKQHLGIDGNALSWLMSYLSERRQRITIQGTLSEPAALQFGVPQGSVLGPLLFGLYTQPLSAIISNMGMCHHLYADDTQLYSAFSPRSSSSITSVTRRIENCVSTIKEWMNSNFLKLNESKTEILCVLQPRAAASLADPLSLHLIDCDLMPSDCVRDLGVLFDSKFNLEKQINAVCKSAYYEIHKIRCIRDFIDEDALRALVQWQVRSRLDY